MQFLRELGASLNYAKVRGLVVHQCIPTTHATLCSSIGQAAPQVTLRTAVGHTLQNPKMNVPQGAREKSFLLLYSSNFSVNTHGDSFLNDLAK